MPFLTWSFFLRSTKVDSTAHIPALAWMDSDEHWRRQLPVLVAGMACYAAFLPLAYRRSAKRFERVDL